MEAALEDLSLLEREAISASSVKPEVHEHKLDQKIEETYDRYKHELKELNRKYPNPKGLQKEIINKIKVFIRSVKILKQPQKTIMQSESCSGH